ncbi:MAG: Transcriptional regulator, MarR family [uncultured Nocardioidaceae bacterium]|uniref:Transcriptional regulator, MarR family n=1 Tax=uncultured Nocardioidaceae bacterium TaxID=253824 RepID=A0A6J4MMU0_9ACTN|nr:MAG: Transcriptional regulator, MarR family [uncultured Nocardioidaceae bacterium]
MDDDSPWLDDRQQRFWRAWVALEARLPAATGRQLQAESGLSLQDFAVLVQLSDSSDGRVRVTDLATSLGWERSRLSHHVTRMVSRGLVQRAECCDDGRGAFVVVTPAGRAAIEEAAPGHARTVRDLVFTSVGDEELEVLTRFTERVLSRLDG